MNLRQKVIMTFDYLFGKGISKSLPINKLDLIISRKTGRLKSIYYQNNLISTFRTDGSIALTIFGANILIKNKKFKSSCVIIDNNVKEFIGNGKSVFAKHIKKCGNNIKPGFDAVVLDEEGKIIAIGKSLLSPTMIFKFKSGVAIKVRESVNK